MVLLKHFWYISLPKEPNKSNPSIIENLVKVNIVMSTIEQGPIEQVIAKNKKHLGQIMDN